jgi:hypothetical protein
VVSLRLIPTTWILVGAGTTALLLAILVPVGCILVRWLCLRELQIPAIDAIADYYKIPDVAQQVKVRKVLEFVACMGPDFSCHVLLPSKILWRIRSSKIAEKQEEMAKLLRQAKADELKYILRSVSFPMLLYVITPRLLRPVDSESCLNRLAHRYALGSDCLASVVKEWTQNESLLSKLDHVSKSIVIDALQKLGLHCYNDRQALVVKLFSSSSGVNLHDLKVVVDDGGDEHTLYKLLYTDLSAENRDKVLRYFEDNAKEDLRAGGSYRTKVLSDVDDTMYCSGGKRFGGIFGAVAGCDDRLGHHMYYPGVFAFYSELQRGDGAVDVPRDVTDVPAESGKSNEHCCKVQRWVLSSLAMISDKVRPCTRARARTHTRACARTGPQKKLLRPRFPLRLPACLGRRGREVEICVRPLRSDPTRRKL